MCDYPPGCSVNCSLPNTAILCFEAFNSGMKIYSSTNVDNAPLSLLLSLHVVLLTCLRNQVKLKHQFLKTTICVIVRFVF